MNKIYLKKTLNLKRVKNYMKTYWLFLASTRGKLIVYNEFTEVIKNSIDFKLRV